MGSVPKLFDGFRCGFIAASALSMDKAYQRSLSQAFVQKIVKSFDKHCFQALLVGRRTNESLWVIDGQHRFTAAVLLKARKLPCIIFASEGVKQEADIWIRINEVRRRPNPVDRFTANLARNDSETVSIDKCLLQLGFRVSRGNAWRNIGATKPLYDALRYGVLTDLLRTLLEAFEDHEKRMQRMACQSIMLSAVGVILRRCKKIDRQRLISVLSEMTPGKWKSLEEGSSGPTGNRGAKVAASFMDRCYNKGLRNRIDVSEWQKLGVVET